MHRVIIHLDMDAFYASVEQRDHPELKGRPVIVGAAPTQRGVVAAASYEARQFGVRSAMPSITAGRLCPRGVFVRPRMEVYRAESQEIMAILRAHGGQLIQQVSVDEAYLEVSAHFPAATVDESLEQARPFALTLKQAIYSNRRLTASIGLAANKLLAKLASDFKKPDGLTLIRESEKIAFLRPLPIRSIHGVGRVTEEVLQRAGIRTVADLQDYPGELRPLVGSWATELKCFAFGEDDRPLDLSEEVKSISAENTFERDTDDRPTLRRCLKEQAAEIAGRLAENRMAARTVQIKLRYGDFTTLTRQMSLEEPFSEAREIYRLSCWILAREKLVNRPLRLLGVGVSGLVETPAEQLRLELAP